MIIVFLILLLMNPCWAIDDYDADLQAAIEASLRESQPQSQVGSDRYPLSTSAFPSGWGARSAPKVSQNYTIQNIFDKVRGADTESDYWQGLETAAPAIKLVGYMDFLDRKNKSKFEKLFKDLDAAGWTSLYNERKLGKRTANNVFLLLDEVKGAFYKALIRADSKTKYSLSINDAMLSLISGKWGFSKCRDVGVMGQLKDAAKRIGRTECEEDNNSNQFAAKIFGVLKEKSSSGVTDQDYKRHRLSAFSYMANGYWDGAGKKTNDLTGLVSAATPKFQAADLKGHPLDDFIKTPAETLKKPLVVKAAETAFTKLVSGLNNVPKGFEGFLKDFDLDDIDCSENQEMLAALQAGLQGKTRQQAEQIVEDVIKGGFLKKPEDRDEQLNLKSILVESGQYAPIVDNIYEKAITQANKKARQGTEPKKGSKSKTIDEKTILWVLEYFSAIEELSCGTRKAYVVQYDGPIGSIAFKQGDEITEGQFNFANQLGALKVLVDQVKNTAFPDVKVGENRVLNLTLQDATVSLVDDYKKVIRTTASNLFREIDEIRQTIAQLSITYNQVIDPNIQPALVAEGTVKNETKPGKDYAVREGVERQKARSRAIDYLIKDARIDSKSKLAALLACWQILC